METAYDIDTIRCSDFCVEYKIPEGVFEEFEKNEEYDDDLETTKSF